MLSLVEYPWLSSPVLLVALMLAVEVGLRFRQASPGMDEERQSLIESARDGLTVLLSLLLEFSFPMSAIH